MFGILVNWIDIPKRKLDSQKTQQHQRQKYWTHMNEIEEHGLIQHADADIDADILAIMVKFGKPGFFSRAWEVDAETGERKQIPVPIKNRKKLKAKWTLDPHFSFRHSFNKSFGYVIVKCPDGTQVLSKVLEEVGNDILVAYENVEVWVSKDWVVYF
jgi:hypothetical protein